MAIKICIDAGHFGKYNQSPANKKYYESEAMWKLHLLQKKYLEQYGIEVVLTRTTQEKDLALASRGKKSKGCNLFISDHSNAVGSGVNESVDYPVVYVPLNGEGNELGQKLADCICSVMGTSQKGRIATRKGSSGGEYYGVIRGAVSVGTVGMILEHSFHTNTKSTKWLLNDSNLDKLAKAEAKVIAEFFGAKLVSEETKSEEKTTMYRVQVGAFSVKSNADLQLAKVKKAGFADAILVKNNGMYKVQVGAYSVKNNADNMLAKVKKAGFDAFITTEGGEAVVVTESPYYPKYTGNSFSVDAVFKAIGVPEKYCGNWKNRKPIATANGINNYSGTAEQNTKLVSLAKKGTLKKV